MPIPWLAPFAFDDCSAPGVQHIKADNRSDLTGWAMALYGTMARADMFWFVASR